MPLLPEECIKLMPFNNFLKGNNNKLEYELKAKSKY